MGFSNTMHKGRKNAKDATKKAHKNCNKHSIHLFNVQIILLIGLLGVGGGGQWKNWVVLKNYHAVAFQQKPTPPGGLQAPPVREIVVAQRMHCIHVVVFFFGSDQDELA